MSSKLYNLYFESFIIYNAVPCSYWDSVELSLLSWKLSQTEKAPPDQAPSVRNAIQPRQLFSQ